MVEVKSPSHRIPTLQAKMGPWLRPGVRPGFLIDTATDTTRGYVAGQPVQTGAGFDNALSGKRVLPGFRLDLRVLRPQS